MCEMQELDRNWFCAVANFKYGTGSLSGVISASLSWLSYAPDSEALLELADSLDERTSVSEEVDRLVVQVFEQLGWDHPSEDDYRWIAILCFLDGAETQSADVISAFLASVATRSRSEFDLLKSFIADVDYLEEGLDIERVRGKIFQKLNEVREPLRDRARQHFKGSDPLLMDMFGL